jgi:hypothetical protein
MRKCIHFFCAHLVTPCCTAVYGVIQSLMFVILIYKGIKVSTGPAQST